MIQPDIDPAREPLVAQGILRVAEALRGVLGHIQSVLGRGAVEESLSGLLRPGTLCGSARGDLLRVRDAVLPTARRAACIRVCAAILAGVSLARRTTARRTCGA